MLYQNGVLAMVLHWLVSAMALMATAYLVPGFKVKDFGSALIAALIIGLVSMVVRPFLMFLAIPFNILTLGLFTFVIDGIVLKICAALLSGFAITSWFSAIFGAFILAVLSTLFHYYIV